MSQQRTGIFWFTNDLRVEDHSALNHAAKQVDKLLCVYVFDNELSQSSLYGLNGIGCAKQQFLFECLDALDICLNDLNQRLHIVEGNTVEQLSRLIDACDITHVFRSRSSGFNENRIWSFLAKEHHSIRFEERETITLFDQQQLPFPLNELPETFTQFRKLVENLAHSDPINRPQALPPTIPVNGSKLIDYNSVETAFHGGVSNAKKQVDAYFSGNLPAHYKDVRNALDGWDNSCKLSPWLAHGCVSTRQIVARVQGYEETTLANDSTYWIFFELLWREYFQWNARRYGNKLFLLSGTKNRTPLNSYYAERFKKWCYGNTPYPLVNACMNELATTGYLSNRGRQIVASCFVNELQLDWRYGAAYFEQTLIDYDVASNWGNWQYLAGVGADAKNKRHFNLEKQTQLFDPHLTYITKWTDGDVNPVLDSVDAADWPIID